MTKPIEPKHPRPQGALQKTETAEIPPVKYGYFKGFDGTKLFYSIEGEGEPLIFCYGLVCSSLHWTYQIDYFRKNYQCIWFDYRGHQNSEMPSDLKTLTIENIAKDLGILMDELNIKEATLLGHSMGVNVVLEAYKQRPESVKSMVLISGTAHRPLEQIFGMNLLGPTFNLLKRLYKTSPSLVRKIWKAQGGNPLVKFFVRLGGFNPHLSSKEDITRYVEQIDAMDPGILFFLVDEYNQYDAASWLHLIHVPTLLVSGARDHIIPPKQQELLAQLIPGSRLETVLHGSHCPQMDLPELVNIQIENFLKKSKC